MSIRRLLRVIGAVVGAIGVAMLLPAVVALIYQEFSDAWQMALAAAVTMGSGGWAWQFGKTDATALTAVSPDCPPREIPTPASHRCEPRRNDSIRPRTLSLTAPPSV